jgi:RNA polymerase sigma-70 factor (ECF subfamily)
MRPQGIGGRLVERLYRRAKAERWHLPVDRFARALEVSAARALGDRQASSWELRRYLLSLHLEDVALACACAAGDDAAWEHFIRQHRPGLYRAADALDPRGRARELADSLYADLYGLQERGAERDPERQSLFRYFHGRSSLATWLRAVLAQRHVDRVRAERRTESLPDEDSAALAARWEQPDPDRARSLMLMRSALDGALSRLDARARLRLGCYYAQGLTLAQIGRLLREHEATVSRQLARTRRAIREDVERQLRNAGLSDAQIARCFECVLEDSGPLDLGEMLHVGAERKERDPDRSLK